MNLKFNSTGQSIKLVSIISTDTTIFGSGNKYWQIVFGHFTSDDTFSFDSNSDTYINTNDSSSSYQNNININYQQTSTSNDLLNNSQNNLIDTLNITNFNIIQFHYIHLPQ